METHPSDDKLLFGSCCPACLFTNWRRALQVVDVNRTSKGARAGRVQGYSALVVVGNQKVGQPLPLLPTNSWGAHAVLPMSPANRFVGSMRGRTASACDALFSIGHSGI
jgi:Ribosomal protein S5, N-terminal domain